MNYWKYDFDNYITWCMTMGIKPNKYSSLKQFNDFIAKQK